MIVFQSLKGIAFSIYLLKSEWRNVFFPKWLWLLKWSERCVPRHTVGISQELESENYWGLEG